MEVVVTVGVGPPPAVAEEPSTALRANKLAAGGNAAFPSIVHTPGVVAGQLNTAVVTLYALSAILLGEAAAY